ncbi:MAG: DUF3068 domain-containing protein [Planctomycetes bacterium]|nr:DUF3068 domain-containing protein [Planctomycetota bacterium]
MNRKTRNALVCAALLLCAAWGLRFVAAPALHELPPNYYLETRYECDGGFRESPDLPLRTEHQVAVRVDQTLLSSGSARIVQSTTSWFTDDGTLTYESAGVYAVHRNTRANVPDLGDVPRHGQFLFPRHVQRGSFTVWDAYLVGPRRAEFVREDTVDELPVLVFDLVADRINDTVAYEFLACVPEQYEVRTSALTTAWVEPVSGIVVDLVDQGKSDFVDPRSAEPVAPIAAWRTWSASGERERMAVRARNERLALLAVERWLPSTALAGAAAAIAVAASCARRTSVASGAVV